MVSGMGVAGEAIPDIGYGVSGQSVTTALARGRDKDAARSDPGISRILRRWHPQSPTSCARSPRFPMRMRRRPSTRFHCSTKNSEPFLAMHLSLPYLRPERLISALVHALRPVGKQRCQARLAAEPHADVVRPAQGPIISIFAPRHISAPLTMSAYSV